MREVAAMLVSLFHLQLSSPASVPSAYYLVRSLLQSPQPPQPLLLLTTRKLPSKFSHPLRDVGTTEITASLSRPLRVGHAKSMECS